MSCCARPRLRLCQSTGTADISESSAFIPCKPRQGMKHDMWDWLDESSRGSRLERYGTVGPLGRLSQTSSLDVVGDDCPSTNSSLDSLPKTIDISRSSTPANSKNTEHIVGLMQLSDRLFSLERQETCHKTDPRHVPSMHAASSPRALRSQRFHV